MIFAPVLLLPEPQVWRVARFWVRSTLWLYAAIIGNGDDIRGRDQIPPGALLVASKHQSAWETLRLMELFERPCFILKRELLWIPLFGWYLSRTGMIGVERGKGSAAMEAMNVRARRAAREGRQIIIFPEGTRRPPLAPPQYRRGAARLYGDLGVSCLPIALNSGLFWPRRSLLHRRGTVLLQCLPAIAPGLTPDAFADRLQATIEAAAQALVAEALAADPELGATL